MSPIIIMKRLTEQDIRSYFANCPQITFEVTEKCNLNCRYCGYGCLYNNKDPRKNRDLSLSDAICLLKSIKELWDNGYDYSGYSILHVSFYGGEPLLNMTLIKEIIQYLEHEFSQYDKEIVYSMTTNGMLLKEYIDYLVDKKFQLLISLDGDEYGNSYRIRHNGSSSYKKVTENLDFVKLRYPIFFEKNIEFNSVLTNRSTYKRTIESIYTRFGKIPTVSEINNVGINPQMLSEFEKIYQSINLEEASQLNLPSKANDSFLNDPFFEVVAKYFNMYSDYFFFDYNELLFLSNTNRVKTPTGTCLPFTKKIFVTVDGKIMPCERIGFQYALGNIVNGILNLDFSKIASIYNDYFSKVEKRCKYCKDYQGCLHCIFNTGQLSSSTGTCNYFVSQHEFEVMKNEVENFVKKYPESYEYIMTKYEII